MREGKVILFSKYGMELCVRGYSDKLHRRRVVDGMMKRYKHYPDKYIHIIPNPIEIKRNSDVGQEKYMRMAYWKMISFKPKEVVA